MKYIWTEDTGAGLHFWELANQHLFHGSFIVESKGSNQGLLDAVRQLVPKEGDRYYLAFDIVYDNMDVVNKYLELRELVAVYAKQIVILDIICFEHIILSFSKLIEWTGTGKKDKIAMREVVLSTIEDHKIDIDRIVDRKTREYLVGFKRYSTERVIKAITYELTENDKWNVKGKRMGDCWYQDCCVSKNMKKTKCGLHERMSGENKIMKLLKDKESQRIEAILYKGER
ncbi:MAG: hypothetical protein HFH32_11365 [Eubacterium sp.]|nr:hypothetical protein [Eubacterium sp.]